MLYLIAGQLQQYWGPLRLFSSFLFLMGLGVATAGLLCWYGLPRLWLRLPYDRGRAHTHSAGAARGKPPGAGLWLLLLLLPVLIMVLPPTMRVWQVVGCLILAMLSGYLDDRSCNSWSEVRKGLIDVGVALLAALALCQGQDMTIWLPLYKLPLIVPLWIYLPAATLLLWLTINATNCSDGVDGLAGTLTLLSLFYLGFFLYVVVGHAEIARYLLIPHNPEGARWALLVLTVAGGVAGYLWHNAEPSQVLMGDAGSRFLGLLVGVAVLASGNPFLILVVAPVVLVNGGTGLVKLLLLRGLKRLGFAVHRPESDSDATGPRPNAIVLLLHRVRFPLHDHCRVKLKWSNAQVLLRFVIVQAFLTPLLFALLVKIR